MDVERRYFDDMQRFLREELGVKPLLVGTSDHNHGKSRLSAAEFHRRGSTWSTATSTGSTRTTSPAEGGKRQGFTIPNTPMVNEPLNSTVVQLARSAVAGKPYTVSEVNHPFPTNTPAKGFRS